MLKTIILVLILAVILGVIFWRVSPQFLNKPEDKNGPITLTVWGLWENEELMRPVIEEYKKSHPNVTINFVQQSTLNYRTRVQTQIVNGQGPDIFVIHNSWLPMFLKVNTVADLPSEIASFNEYSKTFYPVVVSSFSNGGKIYAVPRNIDGLALYYNEDILKAANASVPKTWEQFISSALKTTVSDQNGNITTAGAAMGTTENIDYWSDILALLFFQQPGASLDQPNSPQGAEVLKFYTDFAAEPTKKVWDVSLENSTQSFINGRLAFYFAPSTKINEIRKANPSLNFKTTLVPQLPNSTVSVANFWGYAVSNKSQNQQAAWDFVMFLASVDAQRYFYQQARQFGVYDSPYSRVALQGELVQDPLIGSFVVQAPYYKHWYLSSNTFDQGLNDEMIKNYAEAVNQVLAGQSPFVVLQNTSGQVKQTLDKYSPSSQPAQL